MATILEQSTNKEYVSSQTRLVREIKELMEHQTCFETYGRIGKKIPGETDKENCCKITLPCRYADTKIKIIVYPIE